MGSALAEAARASGHDVVVISGPVEITYSDDIELVPVISTEDMLEAARQLFPSCDGVIGVAAPCDYRPVTVQEQKISKTGGPLQLHLIETPDVIATLGAEKKHGQWLVGFALETEDHRFRALRKLEEKSCDLIISNAPEAMNATETNVEILNDQGRVLKTLVGQKANVAHEIIQTIQDELIS
jgi:phosphopantothenoylcysteine decarboxylase/phosphopantothenate--cysteine ligase